MPNLRSDSFGVAERPSWLGSAHGIWDNRTVRLLISAFTEDDTPDGYIPSGTPLQEDEDGLYGPYRGSGRFAGFLRTDQPISETSVSDDVINVPLFDHGRVDVPNLPEHLNFEVPAAGEDDTNIVYINAERTDEDDDNEGGNG